MTIPAIIFGVAAIAVAYNVFWRRKREIKAMPFPHNWREILSDKVVFYESLNDEEKELFEYKVQEFLFTTKVTGVDTKIELTDKLLVAASAVIPIFSFPKWEYHNLNEVLIYSSELNEKLQTSGDNRYILGMVGNGPMEGLMALSQKALHLGFSNEKDKRNTAIHEFVHLIDKSDGVIDGVPKALMEKQYAIPWLNMVEEKVGDIYANRSDINPYGGTNRAEFFAVISEYFFERPKLLEKKHPELYELLEEIFDHDMSERELEKEIVEVRRNEPCPCGSGEKYKRCCGA